MNDGTKPIEVFSHDDDALELQVERYLEGELTSAQAADFERSLAEPEIGASFREVLLVRELLQSAPPHDVPRGLNASIAEAIEGEMTNAASRLGSEESSAVRPVRSLFEGLAWTYRGPAMAIAGMPRVPSRRSAVDGVDRFSLRQDASLEEVRTTTSRTLSGFASVARIAVGATSVLVTAGNVGSWVAERVRPQAARSSRLTRPWSRR